MHELRDKVKVICRHIESWLLGKSIKDVYVGCLVILVVVVPLGGITVVRSSIESVRRYSSGE